jgi:hypothetical protein
MRECVLVDPRGRPLLKVTKVKAAHQPESEDVADFEQCCESQSGWASFAEAVAALEGEREVRDYKEWLDREELRVCALTRERADALVALAQLAGGHRPCDCPPDQSTGPRFFAAFGPRGTAVPSEALLESYISRVTSETRTCRFLSFHGLLREEEMYRDMEERLLARARSGDPDALFHLGRFLISCGKEAQGMKVLIKMAECGDPRARRVLAEFFLHREKVPSELRRQFFLRWRLDAEKSDREELLYLTALMLQRRHLPKAAIALIEGNTSNGPSGDRRVIQRSKRTQMLLDRLKSKPPQ